VLLLLLLLSFNDLLSAAVEVLVSSRSLLVLSFVGLWKKQKGLRSFQV
jgi:hypothetical protein